MRKILLIKSVLLILFSTLSLTSFARERPKYELGLAAGRAVVPDYPASSDTTTHTIALPSFIYRGSVIRSDRRGHRAQFFKNDYLDLDLSIGASLPANSKNNKVRAGMEDLDFMFELGPRASWTLLFDENQILEIELPYRIVLSTDLSHTEHRGFRFQPQIDYRRTIWGRIRAGLSYKLNYATEKLNDYFYEVNGQDIRVDRERYNAKAGYIGQDTSLSVSYSNYPFFFITGYRISNYHNATNENSPLFKTYENHSLFIAFNYFLFRSKEMGQSTNDLSRQ